MTKQKYIFIENINDLLYYLKKYRKSSFIVVSFNIEVTLWCGKYDINVVNGEDLLEKYRSFDIDGKVTELTLKWKEYYDQDGAYFQIIRRYIYNFYNLLISYELVVRSFFDTYNNIDQIYVFDSKSPFQSSEGLPVKNLAPDLLPPILSYYSKNLNLKLIKLKHRNPTNLNLRSKMRTISKWLANIYLYFSELHIEKNDILTMKFDVDLGRFLETKELMEVEKNYKTIHFIVDSNKRLYSKKVIYFSQLESISKKIFNFDQISYQVSALPKTDELYFNAELFDFQYKYWFSELTDLINLRYQKLEYLLSKTTPKVVISTLNFYDFTPILEILQKKYHFKLLLYPHGARFIELNSFEHLNATAVYPKSWWEHYLSENSHYSTEAVFLETKSEIHKTTANLESKDIILIITAEHPLTIRVYKNNKIFYNELNNLFKDKRAKDYKFIIKPHPLFDFNHLYNLSAEKFENVTVDSKFNIEKYLNRIHSVIYIGSVSTLMFKFKELKIPQYYISSPIINDKTNRAPKYHDLFAKIINDSDAFYDEINNEFGPYNNGEIENIKGIARFNSLSEYIKLELLPNGINTNS